jgi:hypothetical protein
MDKQGITELTDIPKHTDTNAVTHLREILAKHFQYDLGTKLVFEATRVRVLVIEDVHHRLVACVGMSDQALNTWLYSFAANGQSFVSLGRTSSITAYSTWKEGYKKLVHDIRDYWRQRDIDAGAIANSYVLLFSRLP